MKSFTWRQREVCALIARGLTNRRIADDLGISTHMVKMHIEEIMNLTKLENRTQIAVWWVRLQGWRGEQCRGANYTCQDSESSAGEGDDRLPPDPKDGATP